MELKLKINKTIPTRLIVQGYIVILLCLGLLFTLIYLIRFKETIEGNIVLTTQDFPQEINAQINGQLRLFAQEKDFVKKGQVLGYIEQEINYTDLKLLKDRYQDPIPQSIINIDDLELGTLSNFVQDLNDQIRKQNLFKKTNQTQRLIQSKSKEIDLLQRGIGLYKIQDSLMKSDQDLADFRKQVNEELFQEKSISMFDRDISIQESFEKAYAKIDNQGQMNNFAIRIERLKQEQTLLQVEYQTNLELFRANIENAFNRLKDAIKSWEQQYVLTAEIDGYCALNDLMQNGKYINQGAYILTISPQNSGQNFGIMKLPILNSSKVDSGQQVNIKLANYPFKEFGVLEGQVNSIAPIPQDGFFNISIDLPEVLLTTYKEPIRFQQLMTGSAEIITGRYSILDRIWQQLKSERLNNRTNGTGT